MSTIVETGTVAKQGNMSINLILSGNKEEIYQNKSRQRCSATTETKQKEDHTLIADNERNPGE